MLDTNEIRTRQREIPQYLDKLSQMDERTVARTLGVIALQIDEYGREVMAEGGLRTPDIIQALRRTALGAQSPFVRGALLDVLLLVGYCHPAYAGAAAREVLLAHLQDRNDMVVERAVAGAFTMADAEDEEVMLATLKAIAFSTCGTDKVWHDENLLLALTHTLPAMREQALIYAGVKGIGFSPGNNPDSLCRRFTAMAQERDIAPEEIETSAAILDCILTTGSPPPPAPL